MKQQENTYFWVCYIVFLNRKIEIPLHPEMIFKKKAIIKIVKC